MLNKRSIAIFEAPDIVDRLLISKYMAQNVQIGFVEPFYARHHNKGFGYPPAFPDYVYKMVVNNKAKFVKADQLDTREIDLISGEKAVSVIENIYNIYKSDNKEIIEYVSKTVESNDAEKAFKILLSNRLAEFYSMNILLHRIENVYDHECVIVYPDINVYSYHYIERLLRKGGHDFYEHPRIFFPAKVYMHGLLGCVKEYAMLIARLCAQTVASIFFGRNSFKDNGKRLKFLYGIAINSPRQLMTNNKNAAFIVDKKKILPHDAVYFPMFSLSEDQVDQLAEKDCKTYSIPQPGKFFSDHHIWKKLLLFALKQNIFVNDESIKVASITLFNYFRWKKVLSDIIIDNFISHSDYAADHIGRNIALRQAGVRTWFFTDAMNHAVVYRKEESKQDMRMPYCAYLLYDHFITWNEATAEYYREHPDSFKEIHVVGCIWSEHIKEKEQARKETSVINKEIIDNFYILSCFDSSYLRNVRLSYQEGIAFAAHLLRLADECPDVYIILKEKKERDVHYFSDPVFGPKLIEIYNRMDTHPRMKLCPHQADTAEIIAIADMVVSFSFTSPTFEALSVNRAAIWHDPMGFYKDMLYDKVDGLVTHSYEDLKAKILQMKNTKPGEYRNLIPAGSPLLDPYRDGKAVERFRDLLMSN